MKRFVWRLQRLLDLKIKQENILREELLSLSEKAAQIRTQILLHKTSIRARLAQMRQAPKENRISGQQMFLQFVHVLDNKIHSLQETADLLEMERKEKMRQLLDVRKERKSLEKLRENAKTEYQTELNRFEQKNTDDTNATAFARKILLPLQETIMSE